MGTRSSAMLGRSQAARAPLAVHVWSERRKRRGKEVPTDSKRLKNMPSVLYKLVMSPKI